MKYTDPDHSKLLPYCNFAPEQPHPEAWLVGITQIADHLGTNTQQARKKIASGEVHTITVDGILYSNRTWCPNTWYASCGDGCCGPGYPLPRWLSPPDRF